MMLSGSLLLQIQKQLKVKGKGKEETCVPPSDHLSHTLGPGHTQAVNAVRVNSIPSWTDHRNGCWQRRRETQIWHKQQTKVQFCLLNAQNFFDLWECKVDYVLSPATLDLGALGGKEVPGTAAPGNVARESWCPKHKCYLSIWRTWKWFMYWQKLSCKHRGDAINAKMEIRDKLQQVRAVMINMCDIMTEILSSVKEFVKKIDLTSYREAVIWQAPHAVGVEGQVVEEWHSPVPCCAEHQMPLLFCTPLLGCTAVCPLRHLNTSTCSSECQQPIPQWIVCKCGPHWSAPLLCYVGLWEGWGVSGGSQCHLQDVTIVINVIIRIRILILKDNDLSLCWMTALLTKEPAIMCTTSQQSVPLDESVTRWTRATCHQFSQNHVWVAKDLHIDRMHIFTIHIDKFIVTWGPYSNLRAVGKPDFATNCLLIMACSPTL